MNDISHTDNDGPQASDGSDETDALRRPGTGDAREAIAARIGEWQNRLLQLNRRNNLLYFKPARSAVGIIGTAPDALDGRLERSRRGLEFPHVTVTPSRRRSFAAEEDTEETEEPEIRPGDLTTDCEASDLQRRLRNLRNRDREWEEEQGINVLFLAMGFLNWVDADGEPARSPLVLVPCDLERDSPREPYRLLREDDDPVSNPTLRHQLSLLGVELPDFNLESDDDDPIASYLADVGRRITERSRWSVDADIVLGTFSFSKLAMYEDLTRMRDLGVRSELTRMLAGGQVENGARVGGMASATPRDSELAGGRLDDLLDIRDQYTVLPADFSQLRAIDEARRGGNLVIHGPPGTGKSQTISNLIGTLIADGKRDLFVSEKTAALDVVKRRLDECGLGAFCLDLHSDRGRKSQVYAQLRSSIADAREGVAQAVSVDELIEHRDHLNRVVRALHVVREPLGLPVYEVQGHFAQLRDLPRFEQFDVPGAADLTAQWIRDAQDAALRLARRPDEFHEHTTSRWGPLRAPQPSLQLAELIREDMENVHAAVSSLRDAVGPQSTRLGTSEIDSVDDSRNLAELLSLLVDGPVVPAAWLDRDAVGRLRRLAGEQERQQHERQRLEAALSARFIDGPLPSGDYRATAQAIAIPPADEEAIRAVVGTDWQLCVGTEPATLAMQTAELREASDALYQATRAVAEVLADAELRTLAEIDRALELAQSILGLAPIPGDWLTEPALDQLEQDARAAQSLLGELMENESLLHEDFSDVIVDLVDEEMLVRYRTDYQGFWKRLGGAYRRDQRTLRGQLTTPRKLSVHDSLNAVRLAVEVKRQRAQWDGMTPAVEVKFGARFRDRETKWERVISDLTRVRALLADWAGEAPVLRELMTVEADGTARRGLEASFQPLQSASGRYAAAATALDHEALVSPTLELGASREVVRQAVAPLQRVAAGSAWIFGHFVSPPTDLDDLRSIVESGVRLTAIADEDADLAPILSQDFDGFFEDEATDWSVVAGALDWTEKVLDAVGGRVSELLQQHVTDRQPSAAYHERARSVEAAAGEFVRSMEAVDQRFASDATAWDSWGSAPLRPLEVWAGDLREHAGEAASWNAYQEAVQHFEGLLGAGSVDAIRGLTEQAEDVPGIVSRGIYSRWLEEIYDTEPELRAFNRVDHEEARERFRQLDEQFAPAARQRVRERVFAAYPEQHSTPLKAGQLGTLNAELSKRRRQMPVRRLIERIPYVLQTLKPCFLMSPLAVSQYLPAGPLESDHLDFDVVIFDEASQVLPEDALPAIERARQVIVVGDRLQLPPTTFFQGGLGDDDDQGDDPGEDDSFEGRESILDVMVGQVGNGIGERYLTVHYRSRCESLIRFSNHAFYEDRLLTFPGPDPATTCVRDEYLPDATYDSGGSRTNRGEAERVADIVFDLMTRRPAEESVGVVALSRAQADLIETLVEERRLLNRSLDDRFSEDVDERFFVKNLENVQGDERDHMILSVGYGPTPAGAVPNRFGPINLDGGERRLNVAVTRARRSMTVVHSLRPEDIRSTAAGARQLRRYLEYVRNPDQAIEGEVTGTGELESPFEEAVLAALRRRGYRVDAQVGVSGYRIDLAIRSEGSEGYDLGIECDGATYHSSPAARDRDWLRQQVLERLGWRIHRVWSTAWIRDPEGELDAIEQELERARTHLPVADSGQKALTVRPAVQGTLLTPSPDEPLAEAAIDAVPKSDETIELALGRARDGADKPPTPSTREPLRSTSPDRHPTGAEFFHQYRRYEARAPQSDLRSTPLPELARLIRDVVSVEQPVHLDTVIERVRVAFGAGRAGSRAREHIRKALREAIEEGLVQREHGNGAFLRLTDEDGPSLPRRSGGRPIEQIADGEIDLALVAVARRTFGSPPQDLVRETARQFGYRRTGAAISSRLGERIDSLVQDGQLRVQGDTLVATSDASGPTEAPNTST